MQEGEWKCASMQGKYEGSKQTMNNGKSMLLKRMAIAAVCVGMIGSGGLVQANTAKPVKKPVVTPPFKTLKTVKITSMTQMIRVPASKIESVPLGKSDKITRVNLRDFQIGKAEVTGALWSDVYNWAIKNGYTFANEGKNVGRDKPVISVSWRDAVIFANAYSQKLGLDPVYREKDNIIILKNSNELDAFAHVKVVLGRGINKNGYRLLDHHEWELAARWLGTNKPVEGTLARKAISTKGKDNKTYYWAPHNYASGATDDWKNENETARVAWYGQENPQTVCTKVSNALGICDMSGNVAEWQFTLNSLFLKPTTWGFRGIRGGSWDNDSSFMTVSYVNSSEPSTPYTDVGFRLARTSL